MDRYSYLQAMPNSPLTPLTPLSENTQFEFNFGGDGSLDEYIDSVIQEHRVEQQRKKLLQQANQTFQKKLHPPLPRRYSEEFLKIRDVFEVYNHQCKEQNSNQHRKPQLSGKTPIIHTVTTPAGKKKLGSEDDNTPTNIRTPLKLKNNIMVKSSSTKMFSNQQPQKLQQNKIMRQRNKQNLQTKQNRVFIRASPIAAKPLCSQVANILHQCGLTMYYGVFQREEIDILAFRLLRLQDLLDLGITNQSHCAILMKSVHCARQYTYTSDV